MPATKARQSSRRAPPKRNRRARVQPSSAPVSTAPARQVLIATDGSEHAVAALRLARAMADRGDWAPRVLTVCEPLPVSVAGITLPAPAAEHELAITNSTLGHLRQQLRRHGAAGWSLAVEFGRAAPTIVRAAHDAKADLVVLGLSRHSALGRFFGAETAARVIRKTDIPVLAVHSSTKRIPHVAVAAMDFGESSVRAAREALAMLEAPGRLHLVHVRWGYNVTSLRDSEWDRAYMQGVQHGFERLMKELPARDGITITSEIRDGGVLRTLLDSANRIRADLVAFGSHSQTVLDRLVVGSTTAEVLREAQCSVLVAPPVDEHA